MVRQIQFKLNILTFTVQSSNCQSPRSKKGTSSQRFLVSQFFVSKKGTSSQRSYETQNISGLPSYKGFIGYYFDNFKGFLKLCNTFKVFSLSQFFLQNKVFKVYFSMILKIKDGWRLLKIFKDLKYFLHP
jgi:hypothetical protein